MTYTAIVAIGLLMKFFFFAKNIVQCNVMRTSNVRESYYDLKKFFFSKSSL